MGLVKCTQHGAKGIEFVWPPVRNMILSDSRYPGKIDEISLRFEDLAFPSSITGDELRDMGLEQQCSNGVVEFDNEHDAEQAIGLFVPVCAACFNEFMQKYEPL